MLHLPPPCLCLYPPPRQIDLTVSRLVTWPAAGDLQPLRAHGWWLLLCSDKLIKGSRHANATLRYDKTTRILSLESGSSGIIVTQMMLESQTNNTKWVTADTR